MRKAWGQLIDGQEYAQEYRIQKKDGNWIWIRDTGTTVSIGAATSVYGSFFDITERKQSEERIEYLSRFPSENPAPLFRISKDGLLLNANDASIPLLTYWKIGVGDMAPDFLVKIVAEALSSNKASQNIEIEHQKICWSFTSVPVAREDYVNFYGVDATERKKMETLLKKSKERYHELFENSPISIWTEDWSEIHECVDAWRKSGVTDFRKYFDEHKDELHTCFSKIRVIDVNKQTIELFKAKSKEEMKEKLVNVFISNSWENFKNRLIAKIDGQPAFEAEDLCQTLTGHEMNVIVRARISAESKNTWKRIIVSLVDITPVKQAESEIRQLNETLEKRIRDRTAELEAVNEELESFSHSISHDLQVPLRAISGFAQILQDDYTKRLDEEGNRLLSIVYDETIRMQQLIDDLLAFSRSCRLKISPTIVNMKDLANEIFYHLDLLEPERDIKLKLKALPDAYGDMVLLRQVLTNLIANAVKFTTPRARAIIEIGGWSKNGKNIYYVKENGVGFDMRHANQLFGIFERLEHEKIFSGTGMGLAIVKRVVDRHDGQVWAEAVVDQGATFFFSLPSKESVSQPEAA